MFNLCQTEMPHHAFSLKPFAYPFSNPSFFLLSHAWCCILEPILNNMKMETVIAGTPFEQRCWESVRKSSYAK